MLNFQPTTIENKKDLKVATMKLGGKTIDALGAGLDVIVDFSHLTRELVNAFRSLMFQSPNEALEEKFNELMESLKQFAGDDSRDALYFKAMRISIFTDFAGDEISNFHDTELYKVAKKMLNETKEKLNIKDDSENSAAPDSQQQQQEEEGEA